MTAREVLDRVRIVEVWQGLGGPPLRNSRGSAWWRGSESRSVSVSPGKSCWCDHKAGQGGGGVLALVQRVLGCDKRTALEWLAQFYSVDLDNRSQSITERREWGRKREESESWGAELLEFREALLSELRHRRNSIWECALAAERFGRAFIDEPGRDDLWDFCFQCLADESEGQRLDEWVGRIEVMTPAELAALRDRMSARRGIAA